MKTITFLFVALCSVLSFSQTVNEGEILINKTQPDDTYRAGETIKIDAVLKTLSTGIILAHNHPSGKLQASNSDIELTKKIKKAAKLFDIAVLDHLIITPNGDYYSFADNHII